MAESVSRMHVTIGSDIIGLTQSVGLKGCSCSVELYNPSFKHPSNPHIKIWRYMDLSKFLSLLLDRSLHFTRGDTFDDPFEGSVAQANYDVRAYIIENRHTDPELVGWRDISDDDLKSLFNAQAETNKNFRSVCYVSCWHMNEDESAAMWKHYSDEAICIQSTFKRLQEGLPSFVHAGEIKYIDYKKEMIPVGNLFNNFLHKRLSFAHERELRAIILGLPLAPGLPFTIVGTVVPVQIELENLIETIRVSPTSKPWFKDVITRIVWERDLKVPVLQSALSDSPLY